MGRISDALTKLKLNTNVTTKSLKKMNAKERIELCYHLAEVYDAEAILPETTIKKKFQVFKKFARVHSLTHLVPSVKEMKNIKKCVRLVTFLLDMLEEKYGDVLYTRKSWPVACMELPKIEVEVNAGGYNLDNLNLDPDAVPPGSSQMDKFPGMRKALVGGGTEELMPSNFNVKSSAEGLSKTSSDRKCPLGNNSEKTDTLSTSVTFSDPDKGSNTVVERSSPNGDGNFGTSSRTEKIEEENKHASLEQVSKSGHAMKRQLEPRLPSPGSKDIQKKFKTDPSACEQFIRALEDLAKVRPVVEVIGWNETIYTNNRIWQAIQKLVFSRVLLGKELRKYNAKKMTSSDVSTSCQVIVEKNISEEDVNMLKMKLNKLMVQISNAVPDNLFQDIKCAVKASCQSVTLRIKDSDDCT